jgi:hypothetical protein
MNKAENTLFIEQTVWSEFSLILKELGLIVRV